SDRSARARMYWLSRDGRVRRPERAAPPGRVVSGLREAAGPLRRDGFKELKPVPVRVLAVEPAHPGEPVIEEHWVSGVTQPPGPGAEPGHEQAGMRPARGPEVLLHAEVELHTVTSEPAAAARGQRGRFRDLVQPEHVAVELAERWLAARRAGQLHVVDHPASPSLLS